MKRTKLITKSFQPKAWLFLLSFVLVGLGCQRDDLEPITEPQSTLRRIVTSEDIPEVKNTLLRKMGIKDDAKLFSANNGERTNELLIDWEHIKQLVDTTGRETYAFGILDTDPNPQVFYNLILRYSENKEAHQPFILKYTMDEDFLEEYLQTNSLENFRGKVQKIIIIDPLSNNHLQGRAALDGDEGGITVGEPCPNESPVNGGGNDSGSGGSVPTYECSSYLVTTIWYSQACSPSGCEEPVEIGQEQSIVTECGWVNENEAAGSDSDCDPETGEIPIIRIIPDPLDLILRDHNLSDEDLQKLRAALNELIDSQCVYGKMFNHLTSNNVKLGFEYDPTTSVGAFDHTTGTIRFRDTHAITSHTLREEMFHAYQHQFYRSGLGAYTNSGRSNIEFEVKFMIDLMSYVGGHGLCCTAFPSAAANYPEIFADYNAWILEITNDGYSIPNFADIESEYFEWLDVFRDINSAYDYPVDITLNPTAAFNLMNKCR